MCVQVCMRPCSYHTQKQHLPTTSCGSQSVILCPIHTVHSFVRMSRHISWSVVCWLVACVTWRRSTDWRDLLARQKAIIATVTPSRQKIVPKRATCLNLIPRAIFVFTYNFKTLALNICLQTVLWFLNAYIAF